MRLYFLIFFFCAILSLKLPFHFQQLSEQMKKAELDDYSESSCFKTVCFLVSRLTKASISEVGDKLNSLITKYKSAVTINKDSTIIERLMMILNDDKIQRFIGIITDVLGIQDHYFLVEKNNLKLDICQSFQNTYKLSDTMLNPITFSFSNFISTVTNLISLDQNKVYQSIKNLMCYPFMQENQCFSIKKYLTGDQILICKNK